MRILIIWGESLAKPGGGTVHLLGLYRGLRRLGHDVHVISPLYEGQELTDPEIVSAGEAIRVGPRGMKSFLKFQVHSVLRLRRWIKQFRPDAVYVRTCFFQGWQAIISRLRGVPLVGEVDSMVDVEMRLRGESRIAAALMPTVDRFNNLFSSGLACVTDGLRDESIHRWGRRRTTVTIPNGANVDLMQPGDMAAARAELGLPADKVLLAWAGTIAPWQGLELLVESARQLDAATARQVTYVVMGKGQLEGQLKQDIAQGLQDRFVLLGPGSTQRVHTLLAACDAAVISFNAQSILRFGLSSLKFWDAVSMGLPVAVPDGSGLEHVVADLGVPGAYTIGDAKSLAGCIARIVQQVPTLRPRRQEIHQKVREKYSWDCVAKQLAEFLEELIHRRECRDRRERN